MFYEQDMMSFGSNNVDIEYLPSIFSGKIDKEMLI